MTTYYVSTTGNDGNGGSSGSPWLTMSKAMATAVAGDTVRFRDGTYSSAGSLTQTRDGTVNSPITFMSDNYHGATFSSTDVAQQTAFLDFQGDYVVVDGFQVTCPGNSHGVFMRGQFPVARRLAVYHVADFNVSSNGGAGIDFAHLSGYPQIINGICDRCWVVNTGGGQGSSYTFASSVHGIYTANPYGSVTNCFVANVPGYGLHNFHNGTNWAFINNTVVHVATGGIVIGAATPYTNVGSSVINNIVKDSLNYGIREFQDTNGLIGNITYDHNNVSSAVTAYFVYSSAVTYQNVQNAHINDVSGDPLFVNYQADGSGDYRLQAGSPDINAGSTPLAPAYDYLGVSRPQGSQVCLGAYEYVPSQSNKRGGLSLIGA